MRKVDLVDANRDPQALWRDVWRDPVTIEEDGKPVAIVLSPQDYSDLIARAPSRSSTPRRRGLTLDSNDLFGLHEDVFCNDGP